MILFSRKKIIPKNKKLFLGIKSGAAENRTRVQTSYKIAFYMYSLYLVFDNIMTTNNPYIT